MAATLDRQEMYRLARMGAESRLRALEEERGQILRSFPGLKAGGSASAPSQGASTAAGPVRRRRQMSAAERKSVSARMKKYWAERRKAKEGK
ncbi:MAG: hypothetical protein ABIX28_18735 [Vicinamibacterales bacterium]